MGCEVSTPFLNFRNQMKIANYRGDWYLYNGFAFAITFFVSRILFYGYGLVHLIQSRCEPQSVDRCAHRRSSAVELAPFALLVW